MATGSKRVVVASDHGGFDLKEVLETYLRGKGFDVIDVGTHDKGSVDYPLFARAAAEAVASGHAWRGIIVDGAGIGSAMAANKVRGVRAGMAFDARTANNAREHNDANVLTLGAGYLSEDTAKEIVDIFLSVDCTVDRHKRRVAMIDALDDRNPPVWSPPVSSSSSSSAPSKDLVDNITRVLTHNPQLLASLAPRIAAGAPGNVHTTCNPASGCKDGSCAVVDPSVVKRLIPNFKDARVTGVLGMANVGVDLASIIDHTQLKADTTYDQIDQLCREALTCGFASVCVNPYFVKRCADHLRGSRVKTCTVIGFPLGCTPKENKALEARRALRDGARELDMVINIGALKSGDHKAVYDDIRIVTEVARDGGAICKVIIETALLTDDEKVAACVIAKQARAHFVKTSTGFSTAGATEKDVALMARAVDYQLEVKASGGVRSAADANKMIAAGATRIGASVGLKISGCVVPGSSDSNSAY